MFRNVLLVAGVLTVTTTVGYSEWRPYIATRLAKAIMMNPDITPDDDDKAICDGSGYITHGDGHKTPCPGCSACKKDVPEPPKPVDEKCQCGCNSVGCACQSDGNFSKCPEKESEKTAQQVDKTIEQVEKTIEKVEKTIEQVGEAERAVDAFLEAAESLQNETKVEASDADETPKTEILADETPKEKLLVYHFGATWCPPCKLMKSQTWSNPELKKFMEDSNIRLVEFDADTSEHSHFFNYYSILDIPAVLVLDPDNRENPLRRTVGYVSASTMKNILQSELKDE